MAEVEIKESREEQLRQRRRYMRALLDLPFVLTEGRVTCHLIDVNHEGFGFFAREELAEGEIEAFKVMLPPNIAVRGQLKIMWKAPMEGQELWRYGAKVVFGGLSLG